MDVFVGNLSTDALRELPRPWWGNQTAVADPVGPFGEIMSQAAFYELMAELDQFDLIKLKEDPGPGRAAAV